MAVDGSMIAALAGVAEVARRDHFNRSPDLRGSAQCASDRRGKCPVLDDPRMRGVQLTGRAGRSDDTPRGGSHSAERCRTLYL